MVDATRKIGLSLGADACWPICFEDIVSDLKLSIPFAGKDVGFEVERVRIEPFDLRRPAKYDLVIDRLTHWYDMSREWIKKALILDDLYVFNNPWSVQSMEKQTTYCAMIRLGMPIPETWLLPPKEYEDKPDLQATLQRYADFFELKDVGDSLGYPSFMKPYDGGGWVGVSRIDDLAALEASYEKSGKFVMHLQKGVQPYSDFVRCIGVGPQVRHVRYDPSAPLHQRYTEATDFLPEADATHLRDVTLTINSFFGWDFNSCESLRSDETWFPIDFANPCPDSQVTSLHVHFPWLVKAKIRWALYCATTKKKMRLNLDWKPYFEIADEDRSYEDKLKEYATIANERFETERFEEFCERYLGDLDEVAWEYFGSERARKAIRSKVQALFPEHEHDDFTDYFWDKIQSWRDSVAGTTSSET